MKILRSLLRLLGFVIFAYVLAIVLIAVYAHTEQHKQYLLLVALGAWASLAYLIIPRLNRWLTNHYLPNYYIGRTRTTDGLLGDPVNLAFFGTKQEIISAMKKAGWALADDLHKSTALKTIWLTLTRRSYPHAPVSSLFLFGRRQDFAFQQEIGGTTSKRHHIRFWKCPANWYLPGGQKAEWLAAASYDRRVGFSTLNLQITHKIDGNIDEERDYVIETLRSTKPGIDVRWVHNFTNAYHGRNGGGDKIRTDGSMPFIELKT